MNVEKLGEYKMAFEEMYNIVTSAVKILENDGYHIDIDLDALDNETHGFLKLYLLLYGVEDGKHMERWIEVNSRDYMSNDNKFHHNKNINRLLNLDNWHVGVRGEV